MTRRLEPMVTADLHQFPDQESCSACPLVRDDGISVGWRKIQHEVLWVVELRTARHRPGGTLFQFRLCPKHLTQFQRDVRALTK